MDGFRFRVRWISSVDDDDDDDDDATTTRDRASAADSTRTFMTSVDGRDDARARDGRTEVRSRWRRANRRCHDTLVETADRVDSSSRAHDAPTARPMSPGQTSVEARVTGG